MPCKNSSKKKRIHNWAYQKHCYLLKQVIKKKNYSKNLFQYDLETIVNTKDVRYIYQYRQMQMYLDNDHQGTAANLKQEKDKKRKENTKSMVRKTIYRPDHCSKI